jgi:hypothetical protein
MTQRKHRGSTHQLIGDVLSSLMSGDPLLSKDTAYAQLDEKSYKAEVELTDRYQAFTAELLRLALLGIAAFGFLYKETFIGFDPASHPSINIQLAKSLASSGMRLFGVTCVSALVFRYSSSEALRMYLGGLRFKEVEEPAKADRMLKDRAVFLVICIVTKFVAAASLAVGALMTAYAFARLLKLK